MSDTATELDVFVGPDFSNEIEFTLITRGDPTEPGSMGHHWYAIHSRSSDYTCPYTGRALSNHNSVVLTLSTGTQMYMHPSHFDSMKDDLAEFVRARRIENGVPNYQIVVWDGRILFTERDNPRTIGAAKKLAGVK